MAQQFLRSDVKPGSKPVAIVVPVHKPKFTPDEEISLRHLTHFLGANDKFLVVPQSLDINLQGFQVRRFADEFFFDTATYSALLLSSNFYRTFAEYRYILIYQLDALVFSDQLLSWCETGLDYIGAPWLAGVGLDFIETTTVGNGGFSLRRTESFLKITESPGFDKELAKYRDVFDAAKPVYKRILNVPRKLARWVLGRNKRLRASGSADPADMLNEDLFWSFRAKKYFPEFRIGSVSEALRFSFEVAPRQCYELNSRQLPFGCHAWTKYDREFWEPFLLK